MLDCVADVSRMLMSREKMRFSECDARKVVAGRFLTSNDCWLRPQVASFIQSRNPEVVLDPFAGAGDLLRVASNLTGCQIQGLDIQGDQWPRNDSLKSIPRLSDGMIVTNPPYLANYSAKRKGVLEQVEAYYRLSGRDDLYQVALDRCLAACERVVAIVPETLLNSGYDLRHAVSVTVLHDNPFSDTETPVCVVCFDRKSQWDTEIFSDDRKVLTLSQLNSYRLRPKRTDDIRFNVPEGRIGLRAVDMPSPDKPIAFMPRRDLDYDVAGIKVSSRLLTFVEIPKMRNEEVDEVCREANRILARYRKKTRGLSLSPFKGNTKAGSRRRRLDYSSARAILEQALLEIGGAREIPAAKQHLLFA
ncbi:MAG: hypothetical protein WCS31_16575 [Verrucomicrobiae bacterium]